MHGAINTGKRAVPYGRRDQIYSIPVWIPGVDNYKIRRVKRGPIRRACRSDRRGCLAGGGKLGGMELEILRSSLTLIPSVAAVRCHILWRIEPQFDEGRIVGIVLSPPCLYLPFPIHFPGLETWGD